MAAATTARPRTRASEDPGVLRARAAATADPGRAVESMAKAATLEKAASAQAALDADAARAAGDRVVQRWMTAAAEPAAEYADLAARAAAAELAAEKAAEAGDTRLADALGARATALYAAAEVPRARAMELQAVANEALHRRRGMVLRTRAQAVPFTVIGVLWAGAAVGQLVPGGYTLAGLYLCLAVVWWWARGRRAGWADKGRRYRYTVAVTTAAAAWSVWACQAGAGGWRAVLLWAGGYTLAAPYWRRVHIRNPPAGIPAAAEVPEPEPAPPPVQAADRLPPVVELWCEWVACPGGPAQGAELSGRQLIRNGEKWVVHLVREKQNYRDLKSKEYVVCGRMGMKSGQVEFDEHPDGEHMAYLIVTLDKGAAMQSLAYPGPAACFDPATGATHFGRFPDGELMSWQGFSLETGGCAGAIFGSQGSGKSRLAEQLSCTWKGSGLATVWMADPQDGSSLPTLKQHADWAVIGYENGRVARMLDAVDVVGRVRTKLNNVADRDVHPISRRMPALIVVIDEFHMILDPGIVGKEEAAHNLGCLDRVARAYRKAGVGLVLLSQHTDLEVFKKESLRSCVVNYNVVVMRLASRIGAGLIPNFAPRDPTKLPPKGFAYYLGADGGRQVPGRAFDARANLGEWYSRTPRFPEVEAGVQLALRRELGDVYAHRHESVADVTAESVAALLGGWDLDPEILAAIAADDPAVAEKMAEITAAKAGQIWTPPPKRVLGPTGVPVAAAPHRPAERTTPTGNTLRTVWQPLLGVPVAAPEPAATPAPAAQVPVPPRMSIATRAIYDLVPPAGDTIATGEIQSAVTYSWQHVHKVLSSLARQGLVTQPEHGRWTRAA